MKQSACAFKSLPPGRGVASSSKAQAHYCNLSSEGRGKSIRSSNSRAWTLKKHVSKKKKKVRGHSISFRNKRATLTLSYRMSQIFVRLLPSPPYSLPFYLPGLESTGQGGQGLYPCSFPASLPWAWGSWSLGDKDWEDTSQIFEGGPASVLPPCERVCADVLKRECCEPDDWCPVRMCTRLRSRCVQHYLMRELPGAPKPQWCNPQAPGGGAGKTI